PLTGSQEGVVHGFPSSQFGRIARMQTPPTHVSRPLHTVPSSHDRPSGTGELSQRPPTQVSTVHGFPSLHSESTLHGIQSAVGVLVQPVTAELHSSRVHGRPSSQFRMSPAHEPWR